MTEILGTPETFGMLCKRLQTRLNEIDEKGIEKGWL